MYTKIAGYGKGQAVSDLGLTPPSQPVGICFQTSTYSGMGSTVASLEATINYATLLGARSIELPNDSGGYTNIPAGDAHWATWQAALMNNDPGTAAPSFVTLPIRRWRAYRHH
jgi:hypothetical protein